MLLVSAVLQCAYAQSKKGGVVIAVKVGEQLALAGTTYQSDQQFVSGESNTASYKRDETLKNTKIRYTNEGELYLQERHSYSEMTYRLPVPRLKKATLVLKFAELYFKESGQRKFDVFLGKDLLVKDLDIVSEVGKNSAYNLFYELDFEGDQVSIKGRVYAGAYVGQQLVISFAKGNADNPVVSAIVVLQGQKEAVQKQYMALIQNWKESQVMRQAIEEDKIVLQELSRQKNKQKVLIRNDMLASLEEVPEIQLAAETKSASLTAVLRSLVKSTPFAAVQFLVLLFCVVKLSGLFHYVATGLQEDEAEPQAAVTPKVSQPKEAETPSVSPLKKRKK